MPGDYVNGASRDLFLLCFLFFSFFFFFFSFFFSFKKFDQPFSVPGLFSVYLSVCLSARLAFPHHHLFPTEPESGAGWGVGSGWGEPAEFHFGTPVPRLRVPSPGPRVRSPGAGLHALAALGIWLQDPQDVRNSQQTLIGSCLVRSEIATVTIVCAEILLKHSPGRRQQPREAKGI